MTYRINIAAQGSNKPFAFHVRKNLMEAHDTANRILKRSPSLTVTIKEVKP